MTQASIKILDIPDEISVPQSPFLPGTNIQFAWDSTSLGYLKTCPRLYQYIMIDGWSPKDESVHLRFGAEYHSAIEDYDKAKAEGLSHPDAIRRAVRNLMIRSWDWDVDTETRAGKYKNRRTLIQLVIDYFDKFSTDMAETYILANGKPAVELSFKFELGYGPQAAQEDEAICRAREQGNFGEISHLGQPYLLCGHLDRVVRYADELYVLDHKTTTTTPTQHYMSGFNPSNQMTLYTLASQIVYNAPVKGVIIEAAQIKLVEPNHFERGVTHRTQEQLDEWAFHLEYWLNQAESFAVTNYWPMNDTACDKFGGCQFRNICAKSPNVRETWLAGDFIKRPIEDRWNPLKPR